VSTRTENREEKIDREQKIEKKKKMAPVIGLESRERERGEVMLHNTVLSVGAAG